jgi:integrase
VTHRHLRGDHALYGNDGRPATSFFLRNLLGAAQKAAGLQSKAIQELAGHADLTTTMRYMHLAPAARQDAIALLNRREAAPVFGEIVETGGPDSSSLLNR